MDKRILENNFERAVFLKGEKVTAREASRYQWASNHLLGKSVLEIGCSSGYGRQFLPKDIEYVGLDYDATIIDVAVLQDWEGKNTFVHGDINATSIGFFDTIIAFEVIEHLDNGLEIVEMLKNHCNRLLITVPHEEPKGFWGEHHKLHGLNESNFTGLDFYYTNEQGQISKQITPIEENNHFNLLMGIWNKDRILCCVPTYGRYFTTLPLVLQAIANQTRLPDKLIIFDDNEKPIDLRNEVIYQQLFFVLTSKGIDWEVLFAERKGQHYIHQKANTMGYDWVWRCDDDAIPEPNVLETLTSYIDDNLGAVGGTVLNPPNAPTYEINSTGKIQNFATEPNLQWALISEKKFVDHLYSTFLYRSGIVDYNLGLSRIAFTEETQFTYLLKKKGLDVLIVPEAITWHLKNPEGGTRSHSKLESYQHDEQIFQNFLRFQDHTIVVLDSGMGDHIVFNSILSDIHNPLIFSCYPEIIGGSSIAEAKTLFGDLDQWNIYKKMEQWKWTDTLENAYRKLYL